MKFNPWGRGASKLRGGIVMSKLTPEQAEELALNTGMFEALQAHDIEAKAAEARDRMKALTDTMADVDLIERLRRERDELKEQVASYDVATINEMKRLRRQRSETGAENTRLWRALRTLLEEIDELHPAGLSTTWAARDVLMDSEAKLGPGERYVTPTPDTTHRGDPCEKCGVPHDE